MQVCPQAMTPEHLKKADDISTVTEPITSSCLLLLTPLVLRQSLYHRRNKHISVAMPTLSEGGRLWIILVSLCTSSGPRHEMKTEEYPKSSATITTGGYITNKPRAIIIQSFALPCAMGFIIEPLPAKLLW